jgi:hypothetical protein
MEFWHANCKFFINSLKKNNHEVNFVRHSSRANNRMGYRNICIFCGRYYTRITCNCYNLFDIRLSQTRHDNHLNHEKSIGKQRNENIITR